MPGKSFILLGIVAGSAFPQIATVSPGQNGILAQAVSAVVDLSVTNFTNDPALCVPLVK